MRIFDALPTLKYSAALAHSKTPEFKRKVKESIKRIQDWAVHPERNTAFQPGIHFGYGKDACAVAILAKQAGVPVTTVQVINGGDFPDHDRSFFGEFDRWYGDRSHIVHQTERTYLEILVELLAWGAENGVFGQRGRIVNFWDMGDLREELYWEVSDRFFGEYGDEAPDLLLLSGERGAEQMSRFFNFKENGIHQHMPFTKKPGEEAERFCWMGYPIADWRDIDVWAYLIKVDAPISPVYSHHEVPQGGGKQKFPRTYWYPESFLWNKTFYEWMARYYPALVKEMFGLLPELEAKLFPSRAEQIFLKTGIDRNLVPDLLTWV